MRVRPEHAEEYKQWQHDVDEVARRFPGFEATEFYPPTSAEVGTWVVVFRFFPARPADRVARVGGTS